MSKLETQHKKLQIITLYINYLLQELQRKAYSDADQWIALFKNKKIEPQTKSAVACVYNQDLVLNIKHCYYETERFLKVYLKQVYDLSTLNEKQVFDYCYKKKIITRYEKELLYQMANDIDALCALCNEKGDAVVSVELLHYYQAMIAIIKRLNTI